VYINFILNLIEQLDSHITIIKYLLK